MRPITLGFMAFISSMCPPGRCCGRIALPTFLGCKMHPLPALDPRRCGGPLPSGLPAVRWVTPILAEPGQGVVPFLANPRLHVRLPPDGVTRL